MWLEGCHVNPAPVLTSCLSLSQDALESILTAQGNLKFNVVSSFSEKGEEAGFFHCNSLAT